MCVRVCVCICFALREERDGSAASQVVLSCLVFWGFFVIFASLHVESVCFFSGQKQKISEDAL